MFALGVDDLKTIFGGDDWQDLSDLSFLDQKAMVDQSSIRNGMDDRVLDQDGFGLPCAWNLVRGERFERAEARQGQKTYDVRGGFEPVLDSSHEVHGGRYGLGVIWLFYRAIAGFLLFRTQSAAADGTGTGTHTRLLEWTSIEHHLKSD